MTKEFKPSMFDMDAVADKTIQKDQKQANKTSKKIFGNVAANFKRVLEMLATMAQTERDHFLLRLNQLFSDVLNAGPDSDLMKSLTTTTPAQAAPSSSEPDSTEPAPAPAPSTPTPTTVPSPAPAGPTADQVRVEQLEEAIREFVLSNGGTVPLPGGKIDAEAALQTVKTAFEKKIVEAKVPPADMVLKTEVAEKVNEVFDMIDAETKTNGSGVMESMVPGSKKYAIRKEDFVALTKTLKALGKMVGVDKDAEPTAVPLIPTP